MGRNPGATGSVHWLGGAGPPGSPPRLAKAPESPPMIATPNTTWKSLEGVEPAPDVPPRCASVAQGRRGDVATSDRSGLEQACRAPLAARSLTVIEGVVDTRDYAGQT